LDSAKEQQTEKIKNLTKKHKKNELSGKQYADKTPEFNLAVVGAQKWMKNFKLAEDIPDTMIPNSYDFRNLGGYDFTGEVRDQMECGSCYTLGFI